MTKRLIIWALIGASSLMGASCNKWLDQKPQDGVVGDEFWQTKEQVYAAVLGCYASLLGAPSGVSDRPLSEYFFLWGELRADMVAPGVGISFYEQEIINVNILPSNTLSSWAAVYRTINYCNTVLDFAPAVLERDNTLSEQVLNGYLAEARALRGLMYFYLLRTFGEVPLKLTATASDEDIQSVQKSPKEAVLELILADLQQAAPHAPATHGSTYRDKGRITYYTVQAILADVYLWAERYDESIAAADILISSGNFGLIEGNSGWYNTLYFQGNSTESIFEFQFDTQKLNTFYPMFSTSRRRLVASERVMEEIYTINYEDETLKDIRGDYAAVRTSDNAIWKYLGSANQSVSRQAEESYAHWPVYRYAEILLIKAEACARVGRGAEALVLVDQIRERASALEATAQNLQADDTEGITEYVLDERARELAFEGKRWYDVLRNAKRDNYSHISILINVVIAAVPPERQQSAIAKYQDYNSHYLPVSESELLIDKELEQNPFYR